MKKEKNYCFAELVLTDYKLKKLLRKKDYIKYLETKKLSLPLDKELAKAIAKAIKTWAFSLGASHYSHWFMPLNDKTAEKQTSFVEIDKSGKIYEDFSYKSLIKGEADASSFPNGGLRMTFEARGYTIWDYTSPIFIKEDKDKNKVVYIPTAFCSYNGTSLDEKTPLLRATESLNNNSLKLLHLLGHTEIKRTEFNVGAEQEYFLIDTDHYNKRLDLKFTGRTLLGCAPMIKQEESSHYFGMISNDISSIMHEIDRRLWRMGITAKIQHNEAAPSQHEFVPIFNIVNIANDNNQLIMDTISTVAKEHGKTALFHEKPFKHINGSGKHENWSISTDTGLNLFDSKLDDPLLFATFFIAMISAIDKYYPLIRTSSAYYSNDLRLGGDEAPPALISVFTSEYIIEHLTNILNDSKFNTKKSVLETRVKNLLKIEKDFCDRNRTSPFAYTGNKFEFRMPGASQNVAWPSTCMCTMLSSEINDIYTKISNAKGDVKENLKKILKSKLNKHSRIIYNGNCYNDLWKTEAKKRNLIEYKTSLDCFSVLDHKDIIELFENTKVLNKEELSLRKNNSILRYFNALSLEIKVLLKMLNCAIIPTLTSYNKEVVSECKTCDLTGKLKELIEYKNKLSDLLDDLNSENKLNERIEKAKEALSTMTKIRTIYDEIEKNLPHNYLTLPTYDDILF